MSNHHHAPVKQHPHCIVQYEDHLIDNNVEIEAKCMMQTTVTRNKRAELG